MQENSIDREHNVEAALKKAAEKAGGLCLKLLKIIGLPDRLVLLPGGKLFFVETKTTGKTPRGMQLYWHKRLTKLGFSVFVIDTVVDAKNLIETQNSK